MRKYKGWNLYFRFYFTALHTIWLRLGLDFRLFGIWNWNEDDADLTDFSGLNFVA